MTSAILVELVIKLVPSHAFVIFLEQTWPQCRCLPSTKGIIYMVVELNPGPVTPRALRIICRCLKHIAQRN